MAFVDLGYACWHSQLAVNVLQLSTGSKDPEFGLGAGAGEECTTPAGLVGPVAGLTGAMAGPSAVLAAMPQSYMTVGSPSSTRVDRHLGQRSGASRAITHRGAGSPASTRGKHPRRQSRAFRPRPRRRRPSILPRARSPPARDHQVKILSPPHHFPCLDMPGTIYPPGRANIF